MSDERHDIDPAVVQGLARAVPQVEPSSALRARVLSAVGAPAAEARTVSGSTNYGRSSWMAMAAMLLVVVGLTVYTTQLRGRVRTLETDLVDANRRADASQQQIADVRRTAAGAQSAVLVLTAPDVARVDLAGQPVAPSATARAFWSRSSGLVFTGANLPPLSPGRTYQLWVVTAQAPISAGLLRPDAQGGVSGTFATAPDIAQPVAIAVTIEPDGGLPAPSGAKYLVGML